MSSWPLVHPSLQALLETLPGSDFNLDALYARRGAASPIPLLAPCLDGVHLDERWVPGPSGAPDVQLLIYSPEGSGQRPGIFHIHGGGFVLGDTRRSDAEHRRLARETGCVVASVNYRLAPETVHPGPVEDCYAALAWLHAQAAEFGIDTNRLALMGDSAGGGLAAALALLARDRGSIALAFQLLIYPMLDDREPADPHPHTGQYLWTAGSNRFAWTCLLGYPPGGDGVPHYAAPARAEDLAGLPPTFVAVGALDLFLEQNLEYARRLTRAGVSVELHVYPGAYHAFEIAGDTPLKRRCERDVTKALIEALQPDQRQPQASSP